jgi:tRNA-specific 2-thiouridylase
MKKPHGILLYSGGLDSLIAAKILMEQNIELTGFHSILPFYPPDIDPETLPQAKLARSIGLKVHYYFCDKDYIDMLQNPPHGYGKHINPCIDCKILFLKKAGEYMKETGADFVATGEVVGQRPMSQLKDMLRHIEKETGLEGKLLRPLSAKILKPTLIEEKGIINRDLLYDISGRSRKKQMELADKFGILEYSSPAGGCLFTDKFYALKARDLFDHHKNIRPIDLYFLTMGRHFRLKKNLKVIIPRNEKENNELEKYSSFGDYIFTPDFKGPLAFVKGEITESDENTIAAMIARYGSPDETENTIAINKQGEPYRSLSAPPPISNETLDEYRI